MPKTSTAPPAIDRFLVAVESATLSGCDARSVLATLGATAPNWGSRVNGVSPVRSEHAKWFRRSRRVRAGAPADHRKRDCRVQRYLGRSRHATRLAPSAGPHPQQRPWVGDTVPCGDRWPSALLAEMEASNG